jgi:hypothetical protein
MKLVHLMGVAASMLIPVAGLAQCPAVGAAPGCNAVITVNSDGSFNVTGIPANGTNYDASDDALFGIVNNSATPISSITLNGNGIDIFGFEADGIDTPAFGGAFSETGNAIDTTGYGGPNAYFTGISSDFTIGTVNFIAPIAPGGTGYFSLEESFDASAPPTVGGTSSVTPEPGSLVLLGTGVLGFAGVVRRRLRR